MLWDRSLSVRNNVRRWYWLARNRIEFGPWQLALLALVASCWAPAYAQDWSHKSLNQPGQVARYTFTAATDPLSELTTTACPAVVFSWYPDIDQTGGNNAARGTIYSCATTGQATSDCTAVVDLGWYAAVSQAWNKPGVWKLDVTTGPGGGATSQLTAQCEHAGNAKQIHSWPEYLHETIASGSGAWTRTVPRNPNRVGLRIFNLNPGADAGDAVFVFTTGGGMGACNAVVAPCPGNVTTSIGLQVDPGEMLELGDGVSGWDVVTVIGSSNPTGTINLRVMELLTVHAPASPGIGDYVANGDE